MQESLEQFFPLLLSGDRGGARQFIADLVSDGASHEEVADGLFWPALGVLHQLMRADRIEKLASNYAVRTLRSLIDQSQPCYEQQPRNGKRICLFGGPSEGEDSAAQLAADICEAAGYEVWFGGAAVAADEILQEVHSRRPDALVLFASAAADAPMIRSVIDRIRTVGALPSLRIYCGGGIFNRAPGLAQEIGSDGSASSPRGLVELLGELSVIPAAKASAPARMLRRAAG